MTLSRTIRTSLALLGALIAFAAVPGAVQAHGPVAPVATSYLARVGHAPGGLEVKIVDGYVRIWLHAPPRQTVVVLDYRNAPYLRFSRSGVQVNKNSEMYYLNQTPVAEAPPAGLTRSTPPSWEPVSAGHDFEWHDGRLQALASVALAPHQTYVGRWSIAITVDGRRTAISGALWHSVDPSVVWFWPIVVLVLCIVALLRVRSPRLDLWAARALGIVTLLALAAAALARQLHGRPAVTALQLIELAIMLALIAWALWGVLFSRSAWFLSFLIAIAALYLGLSLLPALLHGYVLLALPAFVARAATLLCLAGGSALLLVAVRLATETQDAGTDQR